VKLLLDTNKYTDLARGEPSIIAGVESAEELWLSVITLGELRAGFLGGNRASDNERILDEFLSRPLAGILAVDEITSSIYAQIFQSLKLAVRKIPTNDIWIAAQTLQHNLVLASRDQHFHQVAGLKVI
jgi:tRNA(fMet)-specific endonuclease VapC